MICVPKFVYQDEGVNRIYEARGKGFIALGSTHGQAISNLLGVIWLNLYA